MLGRVEQTERPKHQLDIYALRVVTVVTLVVARNRECLVRSGGCSTSEILFGCANKDERLLSRQDS